VRLKIGVVLVLFLAGVLCVSGREMTAHELETWKRADGAIECHAMPCHTIWRSSLDSKARFLGGPGDSFGKDSVTETG
jgi:hypothetical protein